MLSIVLTTCRLTRQSPGLVNDNFLQCMTVQNVDKPTGEVLVNLTHSGVCHSDLAVMTNAVSTPTVVIRVEQRF